MVNTTVMYDGQQIQLSLPDNPSLDMIYKRLREQMPQTFDFRTHIIQLFDPAIGEFFDLNDEGLKSWKCLPYKEKIHMRLQVIRAETDYDNTAEYEIDTNNNNDMSDVFKKIEHDIDNLFAAIASKTENPIIIRVKKNDFVIIYIQVFKQLPMVFAKILNQLLKNIINIKKKKLNQQKPTYLI